MKNLKKLLALMLALVMVLSLAACGKPAETDKTGTDTGTDTADEKKVLIVTSPSGVDDGSFNEDNYNGINKFIETHKNYKVTAVQEPTGAADASVKAVGDVVADYDIIVTPGFQFAGVATIAKENPEKSFILVDSFPSENGEEVVVENLYAMQFAEEESGFLAGVAAAMTSTTKKVAVVNGIAFPSNVNYQFGFESGVAFANKNYNTGVEVIELAAYKGTDVTGADVGGNYVGDFANPATGKVVGESLIKEGADVIFVAAGGSGIGVFTAAKEATAAGNKVFVIGCDTDQFDLGVDGENNVVLTSALKNMAINVERQLTAVEEGSFAGKNEVLRANTDSTGLVTAEGRHQLSEDTIKNVNAAFDLLKAGKVVPASNFNGNTPDNFPGL